MSISNLVQPEPKDEAPVGTEPDPKDAALDVSTPSPEPVPAQDAPSPVPTAVTPAKDDVLDLIMSRIAPVETVKKHLKLMIYSQPGVGKTTFLGGVPNNLILEAEKGLTTLGGTKLAENVQTIPFKSFAGTELLVNKLAENPKELAHFETFSVDTVSELHKRGLAEVLDYGHALNPNNNRYLAETEDHSENNEHIRRLCASMRDMDRNIILTAHSRTIEPKGQLPKTFPDFSEKLANTLGAMMDVVGYLYVTEIDGKMQRVLMVRTNGNIAAKSRISNGGMPDQIIDPTWDKIWGYFEAHNKKEAANA